MVKLTRLKDVRQRKALTQAQLAERAGVNRVTIARIEGGKDEPFPTTVRKVADALGVEPDDLVDNVPQTRIASAVRGTAGSLGTRISLPDETRVWEILQTTPEMVKLIQEAVDQLIDIIPDAQLRLTTIFEPEEGCVNLFLGISTGLEESDALKALAQFDQGWWIHHAHRAHGQLIIDVE